MYIGFNAGRHGHAGPRKRIEARTDDALSPRLLHVLPAAVLASLLLWAAIAAIVVLIWN